MGLASNETSSWTSSVGASVTSLLLLNLPDSSLGLSDLASTTSDSTSSGASDTVSTALSIWSRKDGDSRVVWLSI